MQIQGNYLNSIGSSDAASAGSVTSRLIESRPTLRPAEVLEFVPGVIVTQHSGDGKANQYFLRGFNLDHGTDFATSVDGMPVNMPTHAHGQGYSDLNLLIPELVERIRYRKGPYFAEEGDFSSAGAARSSLVDTLPRGIGSMTLGQDRYARALIANSHRLDAGGLLYAVEAAHNDGAWEHPEKFHRFNGVLRYSGGDDGEPIDDHGDGLLGRLERHRPDPQACGRCRDGRPLRRDRSHRRRPHRALQPLGRDDAPLDDGEFGQRLRDPLEAEAVLQLHLLSRQPGRRRPVRAIGAAHGLWHGHEPDLESEGRWPHTINTIGLQARHDRLDPVGLYATVARQRSSTTQESQVRATSVGAYIENSTQWLPWLRSVAGLRGDRFDFKVDSSIPENSGRTKASLGSPKLSLIFGPWAETEYFVNYGYGYHSNDARGTTATVAAKPDPDTGIRPAVDRAVPLARSKGGELGLRTESFPACRVARALAASPRLGAGLHRRRRRDRSESGEPAPRCRVEQPLPRDALAADRRRPRDLARPLHRPRSRRRRRPHSRRDREGGIVRRHRRRLRTVVRPASARYFGPRPLVEDNSKRSKATTLAYLRAGYKIRPNVRVALDVFNLFDRKASDIDYYYASRLAGEAAQEDFQFHPVEPRRFRVSLTANF